MTSARKFALGGALLALPLFVLAGAPGLLPGCPVLAITGLPCPTCGATRAVHLLFEGDPGFLRYNAFWGIAVALMFVLAIVMAVRLLWGRPALGRVPLAGLEGLRVRPAAIAGTATSVAALGWIAAMVNLETINHP